MISAARRFLLGMHALLAWECIAGHSVAFGQAPGNQQRADELIRSGERMVILGYVLVGVGIFTILAGVVGAIYQDRKKKARKRARLAAQQGRDAEPAASGKDDHPRT
jgi:hypothetical protein